MGIFNLDSKFMHYANKFADLMLLNIFMTLMKLKKYLMIKVMILLGIHRLK